MLAVMSLLAVACAPELGPSPLGALVYLDAAVERHVPAAPPLPLRDRSALVWSPPAWRPVRTRVRTRYASQGWRRVVRNWVTRDDSPPSGVARNLYYAQPGCDEQVRRLRLYASELLAAQGQPEGVIWFRRGPEGPQVVWEQRFFADEARFGAQDPAQEPHFRAVMAAMRGLLYRFEQVAGPPER